MTGNGPTIFIVDDDDMVRRIGRLLLTSWGWSVRDFSSAPDCLLAVAERSPDCIVSDFDMPGMNGAEFIQALRASGSDVPVVIVTGSDATTRGLARAREAGAHDVLFKPYQRNLFEVVTSLLAAKA